MPSLPSLIIKLVDINSHDGTLKSCIKLDIYKPLLCALPNFILFTSIESSFTLIEELRAVKCFLHHQPVTPSPIHLLALIFLLFVTHWHSEPMVFHPLGPFKMKRVMTLPYCFPWDLVITGCFPKKSKHSLPSLLPPAPPSLSASHRGDRPLSVGRPILVTRLPPAMPGSWPHWESEPLSKAWGLWGVLLLRTHQWQTQAAAPPPFPCFKLLDLREEELCWLGPSLCCWNIPGIDLLAWVGRLEEIPLAAIQNCLHVLWHPSLLYPSSLEVTLYPLYQGEDSHELCILCTSQTCIHTVFSKTRVRSFPPPQPLPSGAMPLSSAWEGEQWGGTVPGVLMGSLLSSITKIPHKVIILISEDRFPFLLFKKNYFDVDNF